MPRSYFCDAALFSLMKGGSRMQNERQNESKEVSTTPRGGVNVSCQPLHMCHDKNRFRLSKSLCELVVDVLFTGMIVKLVEHS